MLDKQFIRDRSHSSVYFKGMEIYRYGFVEWHTVENFVGFDHIKARVKGSSSNFYKVSIIYDTVVDELENVDCQCLAFQKYGGLCKHCVAVLFEYVDYTSGKNKKSPAISVSKWKKSSDDSSKSQRKDQTTTPAMKELLNRHIIKRTLPLIQDSHYGKICIEPIVKCEKRSFQLEFKIGYKHMYILKDIFEFDNAMANNDDISYN